MSDPPGEMTRGHSTPAKTVVKLIIIIIMIYGISRAGHPSANAPIVALTTSECGAEKDVNMQSQRQLELSQFPIASNKNYNNNGNNND